MSTNHKFSASDIELANLAKAIANPARIAILKELAKQKTCVCGEIVNVLPLAQATVSQHLKELKDAGIIQGTIDGTKSCYCINWDKFEGLTGEFLSFFKEIISQKCSDDDCC